MFNVPKKALYKTISRRKFLELGGGTAVALGAGSIPARSASQIDPMRALHYECPPRR